MKRRRKGMMTLAEHDAQLRADGHYDGMIAARKLQDDTIRAKEAEYSRAEAPLLKALAAAGWAVSSAWDLVNTTRPYPELVPILLAHVDRPYPERVREGIARALAVPEARAGWDQLVRSYLSETDPTTSGIKWALHLAIAAAADPSVLGPLITLALDRRHGRNRAVFVDALARMTDPRAAAALATLADDPELAGDVKRVQKSRRARRVRSVAP